MDPLIITLLAITLTLEILTITLFFVLRKKNNTPPPINIDLSEINRLVGGLQSELGHVKDDISNQLKISLQNEMLRVSKQNSEANEQNNAKLERFQGGITESLDKKLTELTKKVDEALANINKRVDEQIKTGFTTTSEQMEKVAKGLGQLQEAQKQIENLKGEVTNLSGILSNNQQRGKFGEFQLSAILHNVFGDTRDLYDLQHEIKNPRTGEKVRPDAVVFLPAPNNKVCIDSKFPYQEYAKIFTREDDSKENRTSFRNAVRNHIKVVREKYIIDGETAPQVLMFIPSDGVYSFINLEFSDLMDEAMRQQVVITSPATLQPMLASIYGLIIEYRRAKHVEEITHSLNALAQDFGKFISSWEKILKNIQTTYNASNEFDSRVRIMNNKFVKIKSVEEIEDQSEE